MLKGLGGLGNLGNMANIFKTVSQLKERYEALNEELAEEEVEGTAGGGMVLVRMNGKMEVLAVSIEREVVNPEEVGMLETLVRAATNEAVRKMNDLKKERFSELTAGLNIPGLT